MSLIRLATAANVRGFQDLSHALSTSDGKWTDSIDYEGLQDQIGRFRVWSGNLGALQKGHSSLDYRLRDSPLLSTNALKFLKELEDNTNEAVAIVTEARLPYELQPKPEKTDEDEDDDDDGFFDDDDDDEDDEGSSRTELSMRFAEIVDIIDNLYKLSVRIRTPTIRSRSLKAATYKPKDPETGIDILSTYATYDLQHVSELLWHLRHAQGQESQSLDHDYLVTRLSAAITLRRRQFKYWKRHRDKLGMSTMQEEQTPPNQPAVDRPHLPQRNDTLEVLPDIPTIVTDKEAPSQKTGKTLLSGTEATQHHQSLDEILDTKSVTSYAVTVKDLHGKGVQLPPPPRAADAEKDFECPYCYIICPARYGRGRAWRTHLLQDLQPYICTYPDCDSSEQLFRSRREWAEHEASHRKAWRCPEHPAAIYKTSTGLEEHFRREHADSFPESQLSAIVKVGETTTIDVRDHCPICSAPAHTDGLGDFHNHIANHLERIATFALPIGNEDESDGASSVASRGRSESSQSRNMSDLSLPSDATDNLEAIPTQGIIESERAGSVDSNASPTLPQPEATLSAESLRQLPDASQTRFEALFGSNPNVPKDLAGKPDTDTDSSVYSDPVPYDMQQDEDEKAIGLNVSEILTLRFLYRSRRLQQRDQSYAPNDSYNQIISYCYHDITKLSVDAVVNGANRAMKVTGGETLNNAIHRAAGPALARETKTKGRIRNQAVLTGGYRLPSKHVIHVLRPGYSSSKGMRQFNQLIDCYRNAFKVAIEHQLKTIAFPCLGTGGVGFPARVAARIILQEVREYLDGHPQHGLERIIFCVNTAADEKAYVDFLPVYFPPTHDDLETARFSVWSEDRAAVVDQVLDARNEIHKVSWELGIGFSQSVPNFTQDILDHISVIDLALASIRRFLLWSNELNQALRDLKLVCSVMQLFCGNITEIVELAKDHTKLGQSNDESIWDDYVADSNKRHGRGPSELLKDCRKFAENLDSMITRKGVEMDEIMGMVDIRQKLEHFKVKQRGGFDAEGTQDHLNEVLYTREFQRETIAQSRDTVKIHQIPSIAQLYKLGELEEKPTLAHPSTPFNDKICLVREDITKLEVDVMVNSTDAAFEGIGTLARTVFLKGGVQLREAVRIVGECKAGDVKLTEGYLLPAKHVLHVVPPDQFRAETKDIMRKIYREVLHTAVTLRATSVAFPCIGTGLLSYPGRASVSLALEEVKRFLESAVPDSLIEKIVFVVFSSNDEFVYKNLLPVYFPPLYAGPGRTPSASVTRQDTGASAASTSSGTPRQTLFGSIGEAFRSLRPGKSSDTPRPITVNEEHALISFESHAKGCETCGDIDRLYLEGRDLCKDGYELAQTVLFHMHMQSDMEVYTKPDAKGRSDKLEVPPDMFPISLGLLATVENSYKDENRSRPFVTPNRPYTAIVQDQKHNLTPRGDMEQDAESKVSDEPKPKKARAQVFVRSDREGDVPSWDALIPHEGQIRVYPDKVNIHGNAVYVGWSPPTVSIELDRRTTVQRHKTTPEVVLSGCRRLKQSEIQTEGDILFRCRSDDECNALLRTIRRAIEGLQAVHDAEGQQETSEVQVEPKSTASDEYMRWNQRLHDIQEELASTKRASGGLSDLQFKMERLSTAVSRLKATNNPQANDALKLYDTSRSPLATRILVCLTADLQQKSADLQRKPTNLQEDYADDDIFDPNLFKKQPADATSYKKPATQSVFQDWEESYNEPQVSQADLSAPKELLQNDNMPKVRVIDPSEGAANFKSQPGSYIGLKTDRIISELGINQVEARMALHELVLEGEIHNTVDVDTWAVTHPPNNLPELSSNNDIRLRVDGTMPLSLQLSGDMEGRTLQLVPAENRMTDLIIGDDEPSEEPLDTNTKDTGTIIASQSIPSSNLNYDPQMALWSLEKVKRTDFWADVKPRQEHIALKELRDELEKFKQKDLTPQRILDDLKSPNCRKVINTLVDNQTKELQKINKTLKWILGGILPEWRWMDRRKKERMLVRVLVILQTAEAVNPMENKYHTVDDGRARIKVFDATAKEDHDERLKAQDKPTDTDLPTNPEQLNDPAPSKTISLSPEAEKVHTYLLNYTFAPPDGAHHILDIAAAVYLTREEVRQALSELKDLGMANVSGKNGWWWATKVEATEDTNTSAPPAQATIVDPPSFSDTPPSPTATSSEPNRLHLDTLNIDDFFSYASPSGARWTRVDRRLIDPRVLVAAEEEFEDVGDSLVVHRVLRRGEIRRWAEESLTVKQGEVGAGGGRVDRGKGKGRRDERDEYQERLDRVIAGDMQEEEMRHFSGDGENDGRFI